MLLGEFFPWWEAAWKSGEEQKKKNSKRCAGAVNKFLKGDITGVKVKLGERNDTLYQLINTKCYKDGLSLQDATELAYTVSNAFGPECGGPLEDSEVETIASSAYEHAAIALEKKTEKNKSYLDHLANLATIPTNGCGAIFEYDYSSGALSNYRFSGLSVMQRVLQRYGKYIVNVDGALFAFSQSQMVWKSQKPRGATINGFVHTCASDVLREPDFDKTFSSIKDIDRFQSPQFVSGVKTQLLDYDDYIEMEGEDFDASPNLLFCKNGVVDIDTGLIRVPVPDDYLLKRTKIEFNPSATCPGWEKFVSEIFQDNEDPEGMAEFLQDLFGYSITGSVDRQKMYVHFGTGSNGKSKVLKALQRLTGGYGTLMSGAALTKNKNAFQNALERVGAEIEGNRVVIIDDLDTATQWNEGAVKNLTGTDMVARKLYKETHAIPNRAKFHIGCNEQPRPESENFAIIRRLCLLPYNKQFEPSDVKEKEIQVMLLAELPGILNWAIEGYKKGRVPEPKEVKASLKEYKKEHFVTEEAVVQLLKKPASDEETKENWHRLSDLLLYVNGHLEAQGKGDKKLTLQNLGRLLSDNLGFTKAKRREGCDPITGYYAFLIKSKNFNNLAQLE